METIKTTEIQHCTVDDIGLSISGEGAEPVITSLNEYLRTFAKPNKSESGGNAMLGGCLCIKCDRPLSGFLGTFTWGIASGEGTCGECGWPARAHHNPKDDNGNIFDGLFEHILQYHPDFVTPPEVSGDQSEAEE